MVWVADLNGENYNLRAIDLNGDGRSEVVADSIFVAMTLGKSGLVKAFNGDGSPFWTYHAGLLDESYTTPDGITAVATGGTAVLLGKDGNAFLKRSMRNGPRTIIDEKVYAEDLNADGLVDMVGSINFGMQGNSLEAWTNGGGDFFNKGYKSMEFPNALYSADLDGDKRKEVLSGIMKYVPNSVGKTYDIAPDKPGYVEALRLDGSLVWSFNTDGGVTVIRSDDVNRDGNPELFVGTGQGMYVLDNKGTQLWKIKTGGQVSSIGFGDINNDGKDEIFVGADRLTVFDYSGKTLWSYVSGSMYGLKVVDLDGDGQTEVIVGANSLRYLESDGSLIWKSESFSKVRGVDVADLNGDGFGEIVGGCFDGNLRVFSASDYLRKKKAEAIYQKAIEYSADKKYALCVDYSSNATELYRTVGDTALTSAAGTLKDKCAKVLLAIEQLNKSYAYLAKADYANATSYADSALETYRQISDMRGMTEASNLKEKIRLIPLASQYINYSSYYFAIGEYDNASYYATQAKSAYTYTGDLSGISGADIILDNVSRMEAYGLVKLALNYSEMGYVNASSYLDDAKQVFVRLNDTDGIAAVDVANVTVSSRIKQTQTINTAKSAVDTALAKLRANIVIIIAFIVVGVIVLLVLLAVALSLYLQAGGEYKNLVPKSRPGKNISSFTSQRKDTGDSSLGSR